MNDDEKLRRLRAFGAPFFVPDGPWVAAAFDRTGGVTDGVLVFGDDGSLEVWTEALSRPPTPISMEVRNVQAATLNSAASTDKAISRVVVEEVNRRVRVDDDWLDVRALESSDVVVFTVKVAGRRRGLIQTVDSSTACG